MQRIGFRLCKELDLDSGLKLFRRYPSISKHQEFKNRYLFFSFIKKTEDIKICLERISIKLFNIYKIDQSMRKNQKRPQTDKNANYKNLISQYYDRDPHLSDVKDQIKAITPEIEILDQLNEFEKKIDALIKTKRYDVQEMYMKPGQKLKRLLRMKVTREFVQGQQTIRLFGYIHPRKQQTSNTKFTSFFRQVTVINEKDKSTIETWKKPVSAFQEKDGLVLKLAINPEDSISIFLSLITNPPKFEVDPLLQKIVGIRVGSRVEVLDAFWLYIKTKKLQDIQNKEIINSDELIRQAFKTQKLTFATINNRVRELLIPVEPIKITLLPGESEKIYDIIVEIQEKPNVDIVPFFSQKLNEEKNDHPFLSLMGKIKKYQNKYRDHTEKLRRHLMKKQLYKNFKSQKIQEIIAQQHQLLKELNVPDPIEDYNRLEYILQNEDQLEREVKHYFQNLNSGAQPRSD